jgi:hypothetical protein
MHQITGYRFFNKGQKKYVMYSTLYERGRFATVHECTDLTDQQAMGKFICEHSHEVDRMIREQEANKKHSKIII